MPAGSLGLHQPSTITNESSRLVGGSLGLPQPSTTTNESSRLVGGSLRREDFSKSLKDLGLTPSAVRDDFKHCIQNLT